MNARTGKLFIFCGFSVRAFLSFIELFNFSAFGLTRALNVLSILATLSIAGGFAILFLMQSDIFCLAISVGFLLSLIPTIITVFRSANPDFSATPDFVAQASMARLFALLFGLVTVSVLLLWAFKLYREGQPMMAMIVVAAIPFYLLSLLFGRLTFLKKLSNLAMNAALAFAVAENFGVAQQEAISALESFSLPGARWRRTQKWGATFIDDTYNANPESMIAALNAFAAMQCDGRKIAVLGDMFELGDDSAELHRKVFAHAMKLGFHLVIGVGEESSKCICNLAYPKLDRLKKKFRVDVSAGDLVLLKASHSMNLGELLL